MQARITMSWELLTPRNPLQQSGHCASRRARQPR